MKGADLFAAERLAERAAALLSRPDAWLSPEGGAYRVRTGADRRRRSPLALDEAAFAVLARAPGLSPRPEGGWWLARGSGRGDADLAARPGAIEEERTVIDGEGRATVVRANGGESPLAWLARRRDGQGRPWLTPMEAAAGERLREDFQKAGRLGRLTVSWDAGPKGAGARGAGPDPLEHGAGARARVAAALEAVGPELRGVLEQVCLRETSLSLAERALALPPRAGKTVLKLALRRLAAHYRIG